MTVRDRLISVLGFLPSEDNAIDGALLDNGLTGTDTYDSIKGVAVKTAALGIFEILLTTADTVKTADLATQFSIKYDRAAVEARIKLLKAELGIVDGSVATINSFPVW